MKRQKLSVTTPPPRIRLIAALIFLMAAGSGGVAWGQLTGPTGFDNATAHTNAQYKCDGSYTIRTWRWAADNNFGPGETGIIKPLTTDRSRDRGYHISSNGGTVTLSPFSTDGGIITVGGTQNIVQNVHNVSSITKSCSDGPYSWSHSSHGNSVVTDYGSWTGNEANFTGTVRVNSSVTLNAGGAPNVPDGTGAVTTNGSPAPYNHETKIVVDGTATAAPQIKSENPWELRIFNFLQNKWYYNNYTLTATSSTPCVYDQRFKWSKWVNHGHPHGWSLDDQGWLIAHCEHEGVYYDRTMPAGSNEPNARIAVEAGSHIRLMGHGTPAKSIGHGTLGSTTAYLNLPNDYYTLMNDEAVVLGSIIYNSNGSNSLDPILGRDAVFGINKTLDKDIKTNSGGGTILVGLNTTSQNKMEITASTGDPGGSFGFSGRGGTVYTGTCIPKGGTANFGNYGENEVYVTEVKLPVALTTGGLQVFNTKKDLQMNHEYTIAQGGTGNLLMMAHTMLTINEKQILSSSHTANTNLMGGDVTFGTNAAETFTGSGSGEYSVVAFGSSYETQDGTAPNNIAAASLCGPTHPWCNNTELNNLVVALPSSPPGIEVSVFRPYLQKVTYRGNCHTSFGGSTGDIIYSSSKASSVTLSGSHKAQWQARRDISITATHNNTFTWTNKGSGGMKWVAGTGISLANGTEYPWSFTNTSTNSTALWQAGNGNIAFGTNNAANWKTEGASATMGWQAKMDITSVRGMTANWISDAAGAHMWWEAGRDISMPNIKALNWSTTNTGSLLWRAGRDITVSVPSGESLAWTNGTNSGAILWDAGGTITANNENGGIFTFTQTGAGNTQWQAREDIKAKGEKTFTSSPTNNGTTMIWRAGRDIETTTATAPNLVTFSKTTATAGLMAWQANGDIRTDTKIKFENTAANNTNMEWLACGNITTHFSNPTTDPTPNYDVVFENASTGNMIWHANTGNITTNSMTTFKNTNTTGSDMGWYAGGDITTHYGKSSTNDAMGEGILFEQAGKGKTSWQAGRDIKTFNTVYFNWSAASDDATPITWLAKRNIIIGGDQVALDGYSTTNPAQAAAKFETTVNNNILLKTNDGMIQTNSKVDFLRNNAGAAVTKLWAGCTSYTRDNNIDIENEFNYIETNQADNALVHLYAENDILSNQDAANTCDTRPAPILFDLSAANSSQTRTLWEAERNINTKGRVDFIYTGATNAGPITWLSRAGYIQTERPVTIKYESTKPIRFLAEDTRHDPARHPSVVTNANASGRRGNIHFYDSVDINRNNQNGGLTEIKAENHIWTAMLNYVDQQSAGDTMNIISHKGDIYLGYNDGTAAQSPRQYVATLNNGSIIQQNPSRGCNWPAYNPVKYDANVFRYTIPASNAKGHLWIKAGWEEKTDRNAVPDYTGNIADSARAAGGNIYFTHIDVNQAVGSKHPTVISIPFSGLWRCDNSLTQDSALRSRAGISRQRYENAGIISGVNRCFTPYPSSSNTTAKDTGLIYRGAIGDLTVDAGNRGNIIFNKGAYLNFQDPSSTGNATFRTRFGDIDMRDPFNVDSMVGSLAFLAQIDNLGDLSKIDFCGCAEERNNVYLQDFEFKAHGASGSVFVGADNNIKLNYGGLQNIGTRHDPFLSKDYTPCPKGGQAKIGYGYDGTTCGDNLHCDAVSTENKARTFLMKFDKDGQGNAITKGGFGAVASDYIDVYKKFEYYGGNGSGMGTVPGTGTLHGENVAGYGLFMKTQANKGNWNINVFTQTPTCPTPCTGTNCGQDYLHMVSRMTFHDDAYIEAHNQKVMLWSPVVETFGLMTLDTKENTGANAEITLKADSLIFHDDFIKKGNKVKLSTWSGLHKDLPVMKFGHMRKTPPFIEAKESDCQTYTECVPCYRYIRYSKDPLHMLDTITIKFGDGAYLERLNTVVFDHTVLTCLTDSFDHVKGGEVQHAQIRTDTFKIRNQVDLFADEKHERDAHLELISEAQMGSKDYAGIYTKHLHMEPIGACGTPYSELWTSDDLALDVVTTSTFGGFGFIHSDVHVENGAHLNAGFTSLRLKGQCYEHMCGTQRMKDLRLDVGAQLHFSVGTTKGLNDEYSDAIEVDRLTTYGSVDVNIEIRPCEKIQKRCYPIIYYKSITPNSLNQLKLNPRRVVIDGEEYPLNLNISTDGVVYVCVGDEVPPALTHTVTIPSVAGVTTEPGAGIWPTPARGNFKFKATFSGSKPLVVRTNRVMNGEPETLTGTKNANGEYEYILPNVQQEVTLSIGPDVVSNAWLAGTAVWSHGEMIYIRVDRADIASIYSVAGQLVRKVELPEGDTSIPMSRGAYVITLKDGSVHKVIVK